MKTKLARLINNIDLRTIRFIAFLVMLGAALLLKAPSDGGTGPY